MKMAFISEFLNSPLFVAVAVFLLIASTVAFTYVYLVGSASDRDVREAQKEIQRVQRELTEKYDELRTDYKRVGVKNFEQHMRILELEKENARLAYRIEQLTKGANYVRATKQIDEHTGSC